MSLEAMMSAGRKGGREGGRRDHRGLTTVGVGKQSGHEQEETPQAGLSNISTRSCLLFGLDSQTTQPTTALVTPSETRGQSLLRQRTEAGAPRKVGLCL